MEQLEQALRDPEIKEEAAELLRSFIERIVLTPTEDGLAAMLHGELAPILELCDEAQKKGQLPEPPSTGSQLSVVAGARNQRYLQLSEGWMRPQNQISRT